ncbi:hypothetical protein MSG28_000127 [Choristoneura fumiferana]|uniref:Uncharacterized protein n=1 Tax=Choristoneura fumiferana TaxID=7141 RepID=A0ACC0JZ84_CHOFU|nr:hypothetical protein MSG28_000127 [Choristoneura fumiferana]
MSIIKTLSMEKDYPVESYRLAYQRKGELLDKNYYQTRRSSAETQTGAASATDGARSTRSRGSTLHLQKWMTQLPEAEELDPPEPDMETWSVEELRKRSKELNLLEVADIVTVNGDKGSPNEKKENDRSPSKSSNSGSQILLVLCAYCAQLYDEPDEKRSRKRWIKNRQHLLIITVRTSPVVVDTIPVCRQCHKKCMSKPNSPLISQKEPPATLRPKEVSPVNSSNRSSTSTCSANCGNRKPKNFSHLERKGAMRIRPEDAPKAALRVIDSIEQSQRMLKSTSYELKTDSPILSRCMHST